MTLSRIICTLSVLAFISCNPGAGQRELEEKLAEKDQQMLLLKEQLRLKQDSLQMLKKEADSAKLQNDTLALYEPELIGDWAVSMLCTETTCEGSAIGDVKNEHWIISYEGRTVVAKAMTAGKVTRVYRGLYKSNQIELKSPENVGNTVISVTLQKKNGNIIEGIREIIRGQECRIIYSVRLEKL